MRDDCFELSASRSRVPDIQAVIAHYCGLHSRSHPGEKEKRLIRARLAEGYSVTDLMDAIDGCHRSPFHCGENSSQRKYQKLSLILRDSDHVTQFLELATSDLTVIN